MGVLAREMAEALRESMDILREKKAARTIEGEPRVLFLKKEFFHSNPVEFLGGAKPLKADERLKQITKSFEILDIRDGELRVALASYQLKGDISQWWKYGKGQIEHTWEVFTYAFQKKYLPPTVRECLRREFEELEQSDSTVVEFEATFTSLSRFAPDLVATEERRCLEFEKRLRLGILIKVMGNMIQDYDRLVESVAHVEIMLEGEETKRRLKRQGFT
ncbi:uncharacterized protein LOC114306930 [Camellia sinensis]|uniref:uncharacterized protein LOC114306930 n=1 Tax=Camellia sinensis TaxID=4442 RepID=UPI001036CAC3|nr:uncharacterized protein LOC114306930 [Camellia sinensis]